MLDKNTELPTQKLQKFIISSRMAKSKNIPVQFEAIIIRETEKAVFVEGKGLIPDGGVCAKCGRKLTHPGSKLIGVGPECLGSWTERDIRLDSITEDDIKYLRSLVTSCEVKTWLPKSMIKNINEIDTTVSIAQKKEDEDFKKVIIQPKKITKKASLFNDELIKIAFDFDRETVDNVKTLSRRRYEPKEKVWYAALTFDNINKLKSFKFDLSEDLKVISDNEFTIKNTNASVPISGLNGELKPFQEEGINFAMSRDGRVIIADEMGLGKTIQALGYLHVCTEKRPAIIVVPASLKENWKQEAEKWIPNVKVKVLYGGKAHNLDKNEDIIVINYDILKGWSKELLKIKPKVLILDEVHNIKNSKAKRTKMVKSIAKKIPHILALSGTPAINRPSELYNAITLIEPKLFSSFFEFGKRYCNAHCNRYGWDYTGASNLDELYEKLKPIMIRRKKADVLTELPDKTYSFVPLNLVNKNEYEVAADDIIGWIKEVKGTHASIKASYAETLVRISTLRQLAVKGALKSSIEWIDNFISSSDQKLVVFAIHREIIDKVMEHYKDIAVKIDGSVPVNERQNVVEKFQTDNNVKIFVGNIKAAGVGLTLTAASNVAFLELPWTPGDLQQAEDRCHRIGQKNAVNVYFLLAKDTIEEDLARLIDSKRKVLNQVLDGNAEIETSNMVSELIDKFNASLTKNF